MNKENIQKANRHFKSAASPTSANVCETVTVGNIEKLISEITKLTTTIIDNLDD